MKKFMKFILIFIMIIIMIIGAVYLINIGLDMKDSAEMRELEEKFSYEIPKISFKDDELDLDYDEDGLTNGEELEYKTDPYNFDTSGNGVSDGAAVKIYKLDPLKYSTANDGISDGAKLMANLDPTKKVPKDMDLTIVEKDITLKADDLNSYSRYLLKDYVGSIKMGDVEIETINKPFILTDFEGEICIPVDSEDIKVYYYNYMLETAEEIKINKIKDNKVYIDIKENNSLPICISLEKTYNSLTNVNITDLGDEYFVFYCDPTSGSDVMKLILKLNDVDQTEVSKVFVYQKGPLFFHEKLTNDQLKHLYNIPDGFDLEYDRLNAISYEVTKKFIKSSMSKIKKTLDPELEDNMDKILYMNEFKNVDMQNTIVEDWTPEEPEPTEKPKPTIVIEDDKNNLYGKTYNIRTTFNVKENGFSFDNFGYEPYNSGGNCAGMSFLALMNFNDVPIPRKWEYTTSFPYKDNYTASYDLSGKEYDKLFTKNLYSFKLINEREISGSVVSKTESNLYEFDTKVLDMVNLYWAYANNKGVPIASVEGLFAKNKNGNLSIAEAAAREFSSNRIGVMNIENKTGAHSVNVYGMKTNPNNPNIIDFLVYDNNYSNNMYIRKNITDRLKIRLILEEKKILGMTGLTKKLDHKYMYNATEDYKDDPYDYTYEDGFNNIFHKNYLTSRGIEFLSDSNYGFK